jgi:putative hemolysin
LTGIDLEDSYEENERIARSVKFRYLPAYRDTFDQAEGFLDVPRFLLSGEQNLKPFLKPPFFVPENAPLDTLLAVFQRENRRVAFVVDEYGGTAGLITRGDILEEIVADVESEYGEKKAEIQQMGPNQWLVDGSTSLEDINYELGMNLEAEGADRIGGWVNAQAEHIPKMGEIVEAQGCRVTVESVRKNRIKLVLMERMPVEKEKDISS